MSNTIPMLVLPVDNKPYFLSNKSNPGQFDNILKQIKESKLSFSNCLIKNAECYFLPTTGAKSELNYKITPFISYCDIIKLPKENLFHDAVIFDKYGIDKVELINLCKRHMAVPHFEEMEYTKVIVDALCDLNE